MALRDTTHRRCETAKPGEEVGEAPNLLLRVGTNRKTWTFVWRVSGKVRKVRLGDTRRWAWPLPG